MPLDICGGEGVYLPSTECDDCESMLQRINALEGGKQDKLIPGENISIEGNVISATGGGGQSYTPGTNIDITGNVISAPNVYSKTEVNNLIADLERLRFEKVNALPATGEDNVIYLVPRTGGGYEQYIWANNEWVDLGEEAIDLSDYQKKLTAGKNIKISGQTINATDTTYGVCDTASATAAKTVTITNFDTLETGVTVTVKFTHANTASMPTLNVNSTGAKGIMRYGTSAAGGRDYLSWPAGAVMTLTYDGTNWQLNDSNTYIIDRTDYSDGGYFSVWKFPSGEMIQTFSQRFRVAINTAWGGAYYSPSIVLPAWKEPFVGTPYIATAHSGDDSRNTILGGISGTSPTQMGNTYLYRFASLSTSDYVIHVAAFGRWR